MLRIDITRDGSQTIVSIAGRLEELHLAELELCCSCAHESIVLDLSELQSADEAAKRHLRDLVERGCRVTGATPYISLLLERAQRRAKE